MDRMAEQWLRENAWTGAFGVRVAAGSLPDGAVLARAMKTLLGQRAQWTDVERLCDLCHKGRGKLSLRGEYTAAEAAGKEIWLTRGDAADQKLPIAIPGATNLPGLGTLTAREGEGTPVRDDPMRQELDREACEGALLRLWQAGDRIRPLGMHGKSRLLSDIYTDKGVPPPKRRQMPVLEKDGEILWAVGACISDTAKLSGKGRAVRLEWTPDGEAPWKNTEDDGGWHHEE